ncbi:dTDP-4-dehydrorhamnose reductase [Devosia sp. YIM 151766]|uniref:dTDP-4-dehydrorhamnose reductase n=1 Tax=Devosia sp. YIM 151766 TaxID=3017325 RepID=UPI00255C6A6C|nr:dTDP-4-dehydrorhamnose reductase [Devosia sp. YIM 151766]WIY54226.1 dTDP-4-dehydrorhamnose reductase [Devosia sp. YIM 151766]
MRIALVGSNGQVGSALLARLPSAWHIVPLARQDADLLVPGAAAAAIDRIRPDVIVNAAAWTAVDNAETDAARAHRVNSEAVRELAAAGADWLISYSTDYVFDGRKASAYRENDATAPLNIYGLSKLAGELAIAERGGNAVIFRTSWVHAPGHANFITTILRLAAERECLRVVDDQIGAPTSAAIIAAATVQTLKRIAEGRPIHAGIYHLAASGATSWYHYAEFIVQCARENGRILPCVIRPISAKQYGQVALRPANSRLDTTKLETALGCIFPSWQEGARQTIIDSINRDGQDSIRLRRGQG